MMIEMVNTDYVDMWLEMHDCFERRTTNAACKKSTFTRMMIVGDKKIEKMVMYDGETAYAAFFFFLPSPFFLRQDAGCWVPFKA
jgi:hypothetical protein